MKDPFQKLGAQGKSQNPIVIFDGVCHLCNGTVNFLLKKDTKGSLRFCAFQSESGKKLTQGRKDIPQDLSTILLLEDGNLSQKSTAILRVLGYLPAPWCWLKVFLFIPPLIRNFVYDFVARNRYRWFGHSESCRLPTEEERSRFV